MFSFSLRSGKPLPCEMSKTAKIAIFAPKSGQIQISKFERISAKNREKSVENRDKWTKTARDFRFSLTTENRRFLALIGRKPLLVHRIYDLTRAPIENRQYRAKIAPNRAKIGTSRAVWGVTLSGMLSRENRSGSRGYRRGGGGFFTAASAATGELSGGERDAVGDQ